MLKVTVLTIFPDIFPGPLGVSLAGKALKKKLWELELVNIRDFGVTKHKNVDDLPCGGGNGMIMRPDVLGNALDFALKNNPNAEIYYPSPRGKSYSQSKAHEISTKKNIIILCGRFEGIDERVIEEYNLEQICVGDYILSGGEIAAYAILDSVIRLIPGVLANPETLKEESFELRTSRLDTSEEFANILLEHPLYTKPVIWRKHVVPELLLSGNHRRIEKWKIDKSIEITKKYRPDLLK